MKQYQFFGMVFVLGSLLMACSPSQEELDANSTQVAKDIFATQTAQAPTATQTPTQTMTPTPTATLTPSPTLTPTNTPTITPTPAPDYSQVNLTADDLPVGCEELPAGQGNFFSPGDPLLDYTVETSYEFECFDFTSYLTVTGATFVLPEARDQLEFDNFAPFGLDAMLAGIGSVSSSNSEPEPLDFPGLSELGDKSVAGEIVYEVAGIALPYRLELVIFRKGEIGNIFILVYPDGELPLISVEEVAGITVSRIDAIYQSDEGKKAAGSTNEEVNCSDPLGCVTYGPADPIRIASALVVSGPNADLGFDSLFGIEVAIDLRGEVAGHSVELQSEDDGCNAAGGQAAGQKIVADPTILGVVGTSCSGAGVPMSSVISEAGYFMVSPSNISPILTDPDHAWNPGYYRTSHNDKVQGEAMADFALNTLGIRTAAAIHDGDPYTESLADAFRETFEEFGGEIVMFTAVTLGDTDMRPVLTSVAAAGPPELIYAPLFSEECITLARQAKEVPGLENTIISAADGCISTAAAEALGEAGEGMYFSGPEISFSGSNYEEFLAGYQEIAGTEPLSVFHAQSFDATNMIFNCIEAVAVLKNDGTIQIGRQAIRDCLNATSGHPGLTGSLECGPYGDCADAKITVSVLEGTDYVAIWP